MMDLHYVQNPKSWEELNLVSFENGESALVRGHPVVERWVLWERKWKQARPWEYKWEQTWQWHQSVNATSVQDWSPYMCFILKGFQILAFQLKG